MLKFLISLILISFSIYDEKLSHKEDINFIYFKTYKYDISDILIDELENKFRIIKEKQNYPLKNSHRKTDGMTYILEYHN